MDNRTRMFLSAGLLVFMGAGIAFAVLREKKEGSARKEETPLPVAADGKGPVVVYYFHGHQRCPGCIRVENSLKEATLETFAEEVKDGKVVFRAINVEDLANIDLVERFSVTARHPVVANERQGPGGPWQEVKNLPRSKQEIGKLLESIIRPMLQ